MEGVALGMGYDTSFFGSFELSRELTAQELVTLLRFHDSRHDDPDVPGTWCKWRVVLPYANVAGSMGSFENDSPRQVLAWDQEEKFYSYVPWLRHLIKEYFAPWGVLLNGTVEWEGEEHGEDLGKIVVVNNVVTVYDGIVRKEYRRRPE